MHQPVRAYSGKNSSVVSPTAGASDPGDDSGSEADDENEGEDTPEVGVWIKLELCA